MTTLRDPLVQPLGKKAGDTFEKALGLRTVGDLLRHYPRRYYTRGELTPLDSLHEGDHVTVLARVAMASVAGPFPGAGGRPGGRPGGRGRGSNRLEVIVTDGTGKLQLTFFAGVGFHAKQLQSGVLALFAGTVSSFRGRRQLVHPEYELLPASAGDDQLTNELAEEFASELIPVYPATAKLTSWAISRHIAAVLDSLDAGQDPLPDEVRERHHLWPRELAIRAIHRPTDREDLRHARKRLKWDEAFTMQAALAQRRHLTAAMPAVPRPPAGDGLAAAFDQRLPFTLTEGQRSVGEVHRPRPGLRLPDEPAAAGRGRVGQDRRRGAGHAPGGGRGRPGRAARADRSARPAALPIDHRDARAAGRRGPARRRRTAGHPGRPAHRLDRRPGTPAPC